MNLGQLIGELLILRDTAIEAGCADDLKALPPVQIVPAGSTMRGVCERVRAVLYNATGPLTSAEIARAAGLPPNKVQTNISTMRGLVRTGSRNSYRYQLAQEDKP